jgi:hypothetical protein
MEELAMEIAGPGRGVRDHAQYQPVELERPASEDGLRSPTTNGIFTTAVSIKPSVQLLRGAPSVFAKIAPVCSAPRQGRRHRRPSRICVECQVTNVGDPVVVHNSDSTMRPRRN